MPSYQYQSLTTDGQTRSGALTASDKAEVVRVLLSRGETATRVDVTDGDGKARPRKRSAPRIATADAPHAHAFGGRPKMSRGEMAAFVRELATALEAGLPLMSALRTIRKQAHGKAAPVILDHLIDRVEAGDPLHVAARDYGRPFDDMITGMLRAADASGEMSEVLHQLADLLERSIELRREVMGATFYPLIVASLIAVSVVVLVTVLVPKLIEPMSANDGFVMPWPTAVVLNTADFIQSYWLGFFIGIAVAVFLWRAWSKVPANRFRIDRAKLRMPLVGRLLRDVSVARFTRTLGTLTVAGLPILDALRITRNTLGNEALMHAIDEVQDQVTAGKPLADPLERSGLFPPLLVQVVSLGERSGRLETMLLHAATAFDRQVNTSITIFTKALPPMLLIVMASVGGFILAAVLLPLIELQSVIG